VTIGSLAWGDYNNDSDLDLIVCGGGSVPLSSIIKLYTNREADLEGDNHPNSSPTAPALIYEEGSTNPVLLKWNSGSDTETPDSGLYYNIRVGTTSGADDVVSGVYGSPLLGNYLRPKLSDGQLGVRLKNLPVGIYYWSVQTIDTGLKASPWSNEETFVVIIPTYTISGRVTLEGSNSEEPIIENFIGFSCGEWLPSTPDISYDADCSNEWKGYIEDINSGDNPDTTWTISNTSNGAYLKTSNSGVGSLWLYKTFVIEPNSNISINTSYRMKRDSLMGPFTCAGIYIWNGTVKPCTADRETGGGDISNPGSTANAIASKVYSYIEPVWGPWLYANLDVNITDSTFTVGYMSKDTLTSQTIYMDIDYLNISNVVVLPILDVVLSLSGALTGTTHPAADDSYSFIGLAEGFYTVTPTLAEYHFFPAERVYPILDCDQFNQDFTGLYETYDSDLDGLPDWWELEHFGNLDQDANDDPDNDGLTNLAEYNIGTNPNNSDTDSDGMPDGWEVDNSLNPLVNDANEDADNDGVTNLEEYLYNTDPNDAGSKPSITNCAELQAIRDNLSGNYYLANDIDCSCTVDWSEGAGFEPINSFTGTFDGQGHKITNLYINRAGVMAVGLFGWSGGSISNVRNRRFIWSQLGSNNLKLLCNRRCQRN
jgi:hypothetical protein